MLSSFPAYFCYLSLFLLHPILYLPLLFSINFILYKTCVIICFNDSYFQTYYFQQLLAPNTENKDYFCTKVNKPSLLFNPLFTFLFGLCFQSLFIVYVQRAISLYPAILFTTSALVCRCCTSFFFLFFNNLICSFLFNYFTIAIFSPKSSFPCFSP